MSIASASRATALKARVKAECLRRAYSGSVKPYGGASYDYATAPAVGVIMSQEHRDKIATPLHAINSNKVAAASGLSQVSETDFAAMEAFTTVLEKRAIADASGTDCKSGCTGMCYGCQTMCTGDCDGCSGCGGSCSYDCSGDCDGWCDGCGGACSYGCNSCGGCGGCGGCGNTCSGNCPTDCSGGCFGDCQGSCSGGTNAP